MKIMSKLMHKGSKTKTELADPENGHKMEVIEKPDAASTY